MVKRNIISGLLLFSLSVLIGPYLVMFGGEQRSEARQELRTVIGQVSEAVTAHEKASAAADADNAGATSDLAAASGKFPLAWAAHAGANARWDGFKVAHAHGNLEGVINIVIGLFLGLIAVGEGYRLAASWLLIAGSWLHGGALVLGNSGLFFMFKVLPLGAPLLVLGLFMVVAGVLWKGFKNA
ncbi:MAG: hypothetical protein ACE5EM_09155 [Sphingomonadales bacterium]